MRGHKEKRKVRNSLSSLASKKLNLYAVNIIIPMFSWLLTATVAIRSAFPGWFSPDVAHEYKMAISKNISDWHAPFLVWLWSWLEPEIFGPIFPFLFQNVMFWAGIGLITFYFSQKIHLWAIVFPPIIICFDFYWVEGWLWKDSALLSMSALSIGLLLVATLKINKIISLVFLSCSIAITGGMTIARWYLFPSFLFVAIIFSIYYFSNTELNKSQYKKYSIYLAAIFALATSVPQLITGLIIKPTYSGIETSIVLLDLARVECSGIPEPESLDQWVPKEFISEGEVGLCENYSSNSINPLFWPQDPRSTHFNILTERSPKLFQHWLEAWRTSPGVLIEHRITTLNLLLANDGDFMVPVKDLDKTFSNTQFGIGEEFGWPSNPGFSKLFAFTPIQQFNLVPTLNDFFGKSIFPVLLFPVFSLVLLYVNQRRIGTWQYLWAALPLFFVINMSLLAPATDSRYISAANFFGYIFLWLCLSQTIQYRALTKQRIKKVESHVE